MWVKEYKLSAGVLGEVQSPLYTKVNRVNDKVYLKIVKRIDFSIFTLIIM